MTLKLADNDIEKLRQVQLLVDTNLHIRYTVNELALQASMSSSKFRSAFLEFTGSNVFAYTQEKRMLLAHRLLHENYLPIKEVARLCGYEYASHFNTAVRKRFGSTARQLRQLPADLKK